MDMKAPFRPKKGYRINKTFNKQEEKSVGTESAMELQYNEKLLHDSSFQLLFQGYYFSMDEEIKKEREIKEAEFS